MAPRANWKGYLRLSLVSCPIALYPASSLSEKVSFNRINRKTGNRLKQQNVDSETGELVPREDMARGYVAKVIAQASQPETAYVLAALDLAEPEPLWTTVVERLRLSADGEGNIGRARAALVYSLAKSGDLAGAKLELAKLDSLEAG